MKDATLVEKIDFRQKIKCYFWYKNAILVEKYNLVREKATRQRGLKCQEKIGVAVASGHPWQNWAKKNNSGGAGYEKCKFGKKKVFLGMKIKF